jgi:hypothetical protein
MLHITSLRTDSSSTIRRYSNNFNIFDEYCLPPISSINDAITLANSIRVSSSSSSMLSGFNY